MSTELSHTTDTITQSTEAEERLEHVRCVLQEAQALARMNSNQGEPFSSLALLVRRALKESA